MEELGIIVENVTKSFKKQVVLNDISVRFNPGKIYGIIGRNGSGKTVLLKCICGLLYPDTGTITVMGNVVGKDVDYPDNIGFIIENPGFLPRLSGYKNLKYLASIRRRATESDIRKYIELVGLEPDNRKPVGNYSLGMRQRLGIAQALMEDPDILILDEPMNGLDDKGVNEIRQVLLKIKEQGKLVIIASHIKEDIEVLCDEVYEMNCGTICAKE